MNAADANAASAFIMNAADSKVNATKAAQVSALNSAAAMGELAGVEHGTYAASNLLTDAVTDHMSLAMIKTMTAISGQNTSILKKILMACPLLTLVLIMMLNITAL